MQPTSLEQLALPPEYQQTAKGEQFLLYDSGPETQRILIFGTQRNLEMLRLSDFWHLQDGTSPLHPGVRGACTPWRTSAYEGWASAAESVRLLPNKTEATYRRMWEQIRTLCSLAHPRKMLLDFEKAAINSFEVWPDTLVRCCFFHLTQNIWRKVQAAGMQADYNHDEELAMRIRQLPACICFALRCTLPVCSCSAATTDATGKRSSPVLRTDLHRAYSTRRHPSGAAVPYLPVELPHRHAQRTTSHDQRRGSMAP